MKEMWSNGPLTTLMGSGALIQALLDIVQHVMAHQDIPYADYALIWTALVGFMSRDATK